MNKYMRGVVLGTMLIAPQAALWADPTPTPKTPTQKMTQDKLDIQKDKQDIQKDVADMKTDKTILTQDEQAVTAARQAMQGAKQTYAQDVTLYGAKDPRTIAAKDAAKDEQKAFVAAVHKRNAERKDLAKDRSDLKKDRADLRHDRRDIRHDDHSSLHHS